MYYDELFNENEITTPVILKKYNNNKETSGYYEFKTKLRENNKIVKKGFYTSGQTGSSIRNALNGICYNNHKVGSIDEDKYFKVKLSTGNNNDGPLTFFFETKTDYERYFIAKI